MSVCLQLTVAYWPFHKEKCRKNEFADAIHSTEPKFAQWMREHGKQAVLKDDEVERLERASSAVSGLSRQEVLQSMYGRMDPRPKGSTYSAEEKALVTAKKVELQQQNLVWTSRQRAWNSVEIPAELGRDCTRYKWYQNQTYVHLFVLLPEAVLAKQVTVKLQPERLEVRLYDDVILRGRCFKAINMDGSTWYVQDGVLSIQILKLNRRGQYSNGCSNADTFWQSVLATCGPEERLPCPHAPLAYYSSFVEPDDVGPVGYSSRQRLQSVST